MKRVIPKWSLFCLLASQAVALEQEPWLGNAYEWIFKADYTYSRFTSVANSVCPLSSPSNGNFVCFDLLFSLPEYSFTAETEFAETPRQPFSWRSFALQAERQWLDDIAGDPISLVTGLNIRAVSTKSLHDVSCPYHANGNIEGTVSLGKEWSKEALWTNRLYGLIGLGTGNRGSPWIRALLSYDYNLEETHRFSLWAETYIGTGDQTEVFIDHFDSYAKIAHRSLDMGIGYAYVFPIWGSLHFDYVRRLIARSFPERVNFFTLRYELPFSPF